MCPFNLTGLNGTIDCSNTVEDKILKIKKKCYIWYIERQIRWNKNRYYYVLFVQLPAVVMVTVVVKNEVKFNLKSKSKWSKLQTNYKSKSQTKFLCKSPSKSKSKFRLQSKSQLQSKSRLQPKSSLESELNFKLKDKYKSKLQSILQSNHYLLSLIWYHPFISQLKLKTKSKL